MEAPRALRAFAALPWSMSLFLVRSRLRPALIRCKPPFSRGTPYVRRRYRRKSSTTKRTPSWPTPNKRSRANTDAIVYGASGFTGRLVAEHLLGTYVATGEVRWAMAGRSTMKLAEVRDLIGGPSNLPLIAADASDPASLKTMAESAKVIISTVGPYQLYGEGLVAACAVAGTHDADLCGEPAGHGGHDPNTVTPRKHPAPALCFRVASTPFLLI